jgi:DnaK suppressor protein
MTRDEILFLRSMLLDRRVDILDRVQRLAAAWQELEERDIELEEEAQKASIARPYDKLDESGKLEIQQIDLALTKINLGDYGVCEACGDDISPQRLQVIPWARLCVDCARDYEQKRMPLPVAPEAVGPARIPDEFQGVSTEHVLQSVYERLQGDDRIDTEDIRLSMRRGVLYLDGVVPGEHEHQIVMQILTDILGFSAIVDRLEINELILENREREDGYPAAGGLGDRLFYDHDDFPEELFETEAGSGHSMESPGRSHVRFD